MSSYLIFTLASMLLCSICYWRIFYLMQMEKPWRAIIPLYNIYLLYGKVLNKTYAVIAAILTIITLIAPSQGLWVFVVWLDEILLAVLGMVCMYRLGKAFGKSKAYCIALALISPIMIIVLAFVGKSEYIGVEPLKTT